MPDDPIFIVGHWRSGTTLLHQLMALDENLATPNVFQVSAPGSFLISGKYYRPLMSKLMKPTRPMDNVKLDVLQPQEDEYALVKLTLDSPLEKIVFPKNKKYFLLDDDFYPKKTKPWKSNFRSFCQRISFTTGKRLLLKNPFHSMRIPLLLEMFPKAKFIHIYRHPLEVIPSTIHMWDVVGRENVLKGKATKPKTEEVSLVFDRVMTTIREDLASVANEAKIEIGFRELEKTPMLTLEKIYDKLEIKASPKFEERIKDWLAETGSYQKNKYLLSETEKQIIERSLKQYFTD